MAQQPLIRFEHVAMQFGPHRVHRDITFAVNPGEVVTILGPSGTGKTVLLKLMIGLLFPTAGKVFSFGQDTAEIDEESLRLIRLKIGMLFQGAALFDSLSVYENIAYPLREAGVEDEQQIKRIVTEKLSIIDLPGIEQKSPSQLSGGQKKRVGLARALASNPKVVLFDEPTTGLDPTSGRMIDELISTLRDKFGITSVVITHDIQSAKRFSDRWIFINNGYIVADGAVNDLISNNSEVQSFIEGRWLSENRVGTNNGSSS